MNSKSLFGQPKLVPVNAMTEKEAIDKAKRILNKLPDGKDYMFLYMDGAVVDYGDVKLSENISVAREADRIERQYLGTSSL